MTHKYTVSIDELGELRDPRFEHELEDKESLDAVLDAASKLNKRQYEIFIRFYLYGEQLSVIADKMGISEPNVRISLFRARETIKKRLTEGGFFDE
jgi:RNA polymerase sigma factor (sigma-70 family)